MGNLRLSTVLSAVAVVAALALGATTLHYYAAYKGTVAELRHEQRQRAVTASALADLASRMHITQEQHQRASKALSEAAKENQEHVETIVPASIADALRM